MAERSADDEKKRPDDEPVALAPLSLLQVALAADRHRRTARIQSTFAILVAVTGTVLIIAAPRVDATVNHREVAPRSPADAPRPRGGGELPQIRMATVVEPIRPADEPRSPEGIATTGGTASSSGPALTISSPLVTIRQTGGTTATADAGGSQGSIIVEGSRVLVGGPATRTDAGTSPLSAREILSQELVRKQTSSSPSSARVQDDEPHADAIPAVSAWQLAREHWELDADEAGTTRRPADPVPLRVTLLVLALTLAAWFVGAARRQSQIAEHYENCALALRLGGKDARMVQRVRRLIALPRSADGAEGLLSAITRALTGR